MHVVTFNSGWLDGVALLILEDPSGVVHFAMYTYPLSFHSIPIRSTYVWLCMPPHFHFNILCSKSYDMPLLFAWSVPQEFIFRITRL